MTTGFSSEEAAGANNPRRETAKEIAARIRAGLHKPWFTETPKKPGDHIISSIAA